MPLTRGTAKKLSETDFESLIDKKLEHFDNIEELRNCDVLSNLCFISGKNKNRKITASASLVLNNVREYFKSRNYVLTDIEQHKSRKRILSLHSNFRQLVRMKQKKETDKSRTRKQDFVKVLRSLFFNERNMTTESRSSSEEASSAEPPMLSVTSSYSSFHSSVGSKASTETSSSVDLNNNSKQPDVEPKATLTPEQKKAVYRYSIGLRGGGALARIPKSTLHYQVNKILKETVAEANQTLDRSKCYVLHFDGKSFQNKNANYKTQERNCYVITRTDKPLELTLGAPFLSDKTSLSIAVAGIKIVKEWQIENCIGGFSMDTTVANTGWKTGACVRMNTGFGINKELIWFPCRHHVAELVLGSALKQYEEKSTSPEFKDFENFKKKWNQGSFNKTKYTQYFDGNSAANIMKKKIEEHFNIAESLAFLEAELEKKQIRGDYKELLELALIFLGKKTNRPIKRPGCTSKARWMQKGIYSLKMYLFRKQKNAGIKEIKLLGDICLFIVFVYIPYWYDCTTATHTLKNDVDFIENIQSFLNINVNLSEAALSQFTNDHLWYMGYHLSALGFFDERITVDEKKEMVAALKINRAASVHDNRKFTFEEGKTYKDFVGKTTMQFFNSMKLDASFLKTDPAAWESNESYRESKEQISYLHVVNDAGERALSAIKTIRAVDENTVQNIIISKSYDRIKEKETINQ